MREDLIEHINWNMVNVSVGVGIIIDAIGTTMKENQERIKNPPNIIILNVEGLPLVVTSDPVEGARRCKAKE